MLAGYAQRSSPTPPQASAGGAGGAPTSWKMSIEPMAGGGMIRGYQDGGMIPGYQDGGGVLLPYQANTAGHVPMVYANGGWVPAYANGGDIPGYFLGGKWGTRFKGLVKKAAPVVLGAINPALGAGVGALISGVENKSLKSALMGGMTGYLGGKALSSGLKGAGLAAGREESLKGGLGALFKGQAKEKALSGFGDAAYKYLADPKKLAALYPAMAELSEQEARENPVSGGQIPSAYTAQSQAVMPQSATPGYVAPAQGYAALPRAGGGLISLPLPGYAMGGSNQDFLYQRASDDEGAYSQGGGGTAAKYLRGKLKKVGPGKLKNVGYKKFPQQQQQIRKQIPQTYAGWGNNQDLPYQDEDTYGQGDEGGTATMPPPPPPVSPFSADPTYRAGLMAETASETGGAPMVGNNPFNMPTASQASQFDPAYGGLMSRLSGQEELGAGPAPGGGFAEGGSIDPSFMELEDEGMPPEIEQVAVMALTGQMPPAQAAELLDEIRKLFPAQIDELTNQIRVMAASEGGADGLVSEGFLPPYPDNGLQGNGEADDTVAIGPMPTSGYQNGGSTGDFETAFQERVAGGGPLPVRALLAGGEDIVNAKDAAAGRQELIDAATGIDPRLSPGAAVWDDFVGNINR